MSGTKISRRYAKALFEFAQEQNSLEQIKADMSYIHQLCEQSSDFVAMLKSPVIKVKKKLEIIKEILGQQISETSMKFLAIIANGRREVIIHSMAEQFLLMYNDFIGLKTVKLVSSTELSGEIKKQIKTLLESQSNKQVQFEEQIQEDLVGGFILKMDDMQFDASVKSKLARLKHELSQQY